MSKKYSKEELAELPYWNNKLDVEKRVEDLLSRMTLEEKYNLCSGSRFFFTKKIKRLGIKRFKMSDGPHGVGALGTFFIKTTTYFPVGICRCATWNPELAEKFGVAIAKELRSVGYHMNLGPSVNIQRTPLCGRNFEYQTEDPHLNSMMTVAVVKGQQSVPHRISTCVKHYVANNQEKSRFTVNAEISERALHEIYFPAFEASVREADAWSVMGCYNRINGIYGCENDYILKDKLMNEWGFRGFVVSDWWATKKIKTTEGCINAGLSLEMPTAIKYKKKKLRKAFAEGKFSEEILNDNIKRLLRVMFLVGLFDPKNEIPKGRRNTADHQAIAREIAEEGIILLKNENNLLPLDMNSVKKIAVIGPNANKKHAFGGGSSMIRAKYEITPLKGIKEKCKNKVDIIKSVVEADVVILCVGLNHKKWNDSEGNDRKDFFLPKKQIELIKQTVSENPKTIIVLINGSPVEMDWIDEVPALIEAWYSGMDGGRAIADILFGDVNPSGKLPLTFPKKLKDSPAHESQRTYPGFVEKRSASTFSSKITDEKVYYDEGIFVGYRHFDSKGIEPLFPFGFGLSYTTFSFENLQISKSEMAADETISLTCEITNTGDREGAEVAQLYVQDVESSVERPLKELKGFKKIKLRPGEKGTVKFQLVKRDLSFYDEQEHCWKAERGKFKILIGSSSRDIHLEGEIEYIG